MASRPTGSDELVYIQSETVSLTIRGPAWHPNTKGVGYREKRATLTAFCMEHCELNLTSEAELMWKRSFGKTRLCGYCTVPRFFEGQQYEIELGAGLWRLKNATAEESVSLWQKRDGHRQQIPTKSQSKRVLTATLRLDNTVGPLELVVCVDGKDALCVTLEVFPSRESYRTDYAEMYRELSNAVYRATWRELIHQIPDGGQQEGPGNSIFDLLNVLCRRYETFLKTAEQLLAHPSRAFVQGRRAREAELTQSLIRAVLNGLLRVRRTCLRSGNRVNRTVLARLSGMIQGLLRRYRPLTGISAENAAFVLPPEAAQLAALSDGGRALCRDGAQLLQGFSVIDGLFSISLSQLVSLYPYWCFAKLQSLIELDDTWVLIAQERLPTARPASPALPLLRGDPVRVQYHNRSTKETLTLTYRPGQAATETTALRQDINRTGPAKQKPLAHGLYLEVSGVAAPRSCVFDAQYHFNPAAPGTEYHARVCPVPGPEKEDIRAIYRYRENTVRQTGQIGQAGFGAYVLFPYEGEQVYCGHRFYRSIQKVNVGGLPFLPSASSLVYAHLRRFLMLSAVPAQLPLPAPVEEQLKMVNWAARDVLIGTLSSRRQLKVSLEARFYHIPAEQLKKTDFPIRYIAIYQSRNLFGKEAGVQYYGEVQQHALVRRGDIREIAARPRTEHKLYYRFEIKEWKQLEKPIVAKEMRFITGFTNRFLLTTATELPELWLRTGEMYRLYITLRDAIRTYTPEKPEESENSEQSKDTEPPQELADIERPEEPVQDPEEDPEEEPENSQTQEVRAPEEPRVSFAFGNFTVTVTETQISVTRGEEPFAHYDTAEFSRSPNAVLTRMQAELIDGTQPPAP